jgi:hypothetical protein
MSSSHQRRVVTYLRPKNEILVKSFAEINEISLSETINICVKDFFQRLPAEQKIDYFNKAKGKNSFK